MFIETVCYKTSLRTRESDRFVKPLSVIGDGATIVFRQKIESCPVGKATSANVDRRRRTVLRSFFPGECRWISRRAGYASPFRADGRPWFRGACLHTRRVGRRTLGPRAVIYLYVPSRGTTWGGRSTTIYSSPTRNTISRPFVNRRRSDTITRVYLFPGATTPTRTHRSPLFARVCCCDVTARRIFPPFPVNRSIIVAQRRDGNLLLYSTHTHTPSCRHR